METCILPFIAPILVFLMLISRGAILGFKSWTFVGEMTRCDSLRNRRRDNMMSSWAIFAHARQCVGVLDAQHFLLPIMQLLPASPLCCLTLPETENKRLRWALKPDREMVD